MAIGKRRPASPGLDSQGWLLTFSDMVTLLLTFFVLIISITTTDPKSLAVQEGDVLAVDAKAAEIMGPGVLGFSNPALLEPLVQLVANAEKLPPDAMFDQREIKAALFQLDPQSTPDYQELEAAVRDSVSVFLDERGVVIRWDKAILFPEGSAVLRPETLPLLGRVAALLAQLTLPVSLDCHSNPFSELEGGTSAAAFSLTARRAKAVMGYFVGLGLPAGRFRLGAFGGSRPVTTIAQDGARNARLEIVVYRPAKTSWKG
jgi:chemotaxis protein MotB